MLRAAKHDTTDLAYPFSLSFDDALPPQERMLRFFDRTMEQQQVQKLMDGHMRGCPIGNLTLEMSTQDELIRARVEQFFRAWLSYFEGMLRDAKGQGIVPAALDTVITAQALLAYFEGVILLAKGRNDPALPVSAGRPALGHSG